MNWEGKIKKYREEVQINSCEDKIQETIRNSKNAFLMAEQE